MASLPVGPRRVLAPNVTHALLRATMRACLTLAAAAASLAGQGMPVNGSSHAISIGFGGGMSVPTTDAKNAFKTGVNGQGFVLVHLGPLPAVRLNLSYQKFDLKDELRSAIGASAASSTILGSDAGLSFSLFNGPVSPYVTAGLGAFDVRSSVTPSSGTAASSNSVTTSNVDFGVTGGAGLAILFGRVSGFVEGRVQNVYTKSGGAVNPKSVQSIPVTFGLLVGL